MSLLCFVFWFVMSHYSYVFVCLFVFCLFVCLLLVVFVGVVVIGIIGVVVAFLLFKHICLFCVVSAYVSGQAPPAVVFDVCIVSMSVVVAILIAIAITITIFNWLVMVAMTMTITAAVVMFFCHYGGGDDMCCQGEGVQC